MKEQTTAGLDLNFATSYLLEDEIYRQLDKMEVLTALQTLLNSAEAQPTRAQLLYYCVILEEQIVKMRTLIDQLFV